MSPPGFVTYASLPAGLPPRGLTRLAAAAYLGVDPAEFDRAVEEGLLSQATLPGGVFDKILLDADADRLSGIDRRVGSVVTGHVEAGVGPHGSSPTQSPATTNSAVAAWLGFFPEQLAFIEARYEADDAASLPEAPDPTPLMVRGLISPHRVVQLDC